MHSLSKMAAVRYFPSIHDNTSDNMKIWAFEPKPKQLNSQNISYTSHSCKTGADQNSSASQQVEAKPAWKTSRCLAASEYRPLDVFSGTAEDPGSASWSEAEEICELLIRLKEIELCNMMGETSGIPECK